MTNEDGTVQVVFNGEIYNHLALRKELVAKGHRFKTDHSDTEVIVHGYEEWGAAVVERIHGMFGIGIWDAERAPPVPGARPGRDQAALLHVDALRLPVRLRDQGAARAPRRHGRRRAALGLPLPLVPDDARPAHDVPRRLQDARGLPRVREAGRLDEGRGLLGRAARPRRGSLRAAEAQRQGAARLRRAAHAAALRRRRREAPDVGRAVRGAALGRDRFLGERGA